MIDAMVVCAALAYLHPPATRADMEMIRAVEDFARATPPEPYRAMIAALGSEKWADREAASRALATAVRSDPGLLRWLFVGRRDRDPEIRLRSNAILRRLAPCESCKGSGRSSNWSEYPCSDCGGAGSAWPFSMWD